MTAPVGTIVSGAGGFLGRAVVTRLQAEGVTVFAPPRAELDFRDAAAVERAFAAVPAAMVFHLASSGVFAAADDPPIVDDELAMARAVAIAARPGTRVVFAGSMAEYGNSGRLRESDPVLPRNAYARAKVAAGRILADGAGSGGYALVHARLFGLYGPGEAATRLLPSILAALTAGQPIALSDGRQRRDFVHIDDAARALCDLAGCASPPPLVNVGTGRALAVRDVALALARELTADPALLRFGDRQRSPHDQDCLEADTAVLRQAIGWTPPQRLEPGLALLPELGVASGANRLETRR